MQPRRVRARSLGWPLVGMVLMRASSANAEASGEAVDEKAAAGESAQTLEPESPSDEDLSRSAARQRDAAGLSTAVVNVILPRHLGRVPGAATRLSRSDLDEMRPYNMHEALRRIPGVNVIDDDGMSRRGNIGLRGGAPRRSRKVLLLEDGVSINASSYLDPSTHYTPPIERLESIEVLRGTGQIVYGPLNNHGIINFRNLQPTLEPETVVSAALDSNNGNRRHARHRRTLGNFGVVLAYTGADADGVFDTERMGWNDFYGSGTYTIGRHELTIAGVHYRERSRYDETNLTQAEFEAHPRCKTCLGGERGGVRFNTFSADYTRIAFNARSRVSERASLSSTVHGSLLDRPRFESRRGGPVAEGGSMRGRDREYRQLGAESRLEVSKLMLGDVRNDVQGGLRMELHGFENRNVSGRLNEVLDYDHRGSPLAVRGIDGYGDDGALERLTAVAYSGFVQDAVSFGDFTVMPGLRVEHYSQRKRSVFRGAEAITVPYESDRRLMVLPGVSVLFDGLRRTTLYGGVHRGYAPAVARTESFPLRPEIGINSQLGVRTHAIKGLRTELAVFHNALEDTLLRLSYTDVRGNNIFINSGSARVIGAEVLARIDTRAYTRSRLNAFAEIAYTLVDARFRTSELEGKRLPEIPRHLATTSVGLEHASGWDVSMTFAHRGAFFTDVDNTVQGSEEGELGQVQAQALFSARANYRIPRTAITLFASGTNLTDRLYISDRQDGIKPILPRTVLVGVSARLD